MCLVFLYHSEVFYGKSHLWSWLFTPIFLSAFFFVSGYLFSSNWEERVNSSNVKCFVSVIYSYSLFPVYGGIYFA